MHVDQAGHEDFSTGVKTCVPQVARLADPDNFAVTHTECGLFQDGVILVASHNQRIGYRNFSGQNIAPPGL